MSLFFYERNRIYKALFVRKTITYIVKSIKDIKANFTAKQIDINAIIFPYIINEIDFFLYHNMKQIFEDC